jgi:hypothetical protein
MNPLRSLSRPILAIGMLVLFATPLPAILPYLDPAAQGTTFTIIFPDNTYVVATSNDLVALQPNQVVTVNVQMPSSGGPPPDEFDTTPTIDIEPLDGGILTGSPAEQSWDGKFNFIFQAPANPGTAQVDMHGATAEIGLQFFVIDPDDPTNHPPTIN